MDRKASPIAIFAAGFVAGALVLGAAGVASAGGSIFLLNLSIAGVPPGSQGSLLCATASGQVRAVAGASRPLSVNATGGGVSTGVTMICPP